MFGLKLVTKNGMEKIEQEARDKALREFIEILKCKNKIYLKPLTLKGDYQKISDNAFFGNPGIYVKSNK